MRITGGTLRSRAIRAPSGPATRPTTDRVREALFGILTSAGGISGARVLDLYAGTGALAFEALSRGAEEAVVVESSREALAVLRANVASLDLGAKVRIVAGDVARAVRRLVQAPARAEPAAVGPRPFDLVFADPPWATIEAGGPGEALAALAAGGGVADEGRIVLEHASRTIPLDVEGLLRLDTRRYGDTALTFYKPAILAALRSQRAQVTSE
jgi:16S rRNA (guanine966-N2)-methyltransferase